VRQEGRINLANEKIANLDDKHKTAKQGLTRGAETTRAQVEEWPRHTDAKTDALGVSISAKFDKVFDKMDHKLDKP